MFADLLDIDWASLSHAYGTAEDVPPILQGLLSEDPDAREIALDQFHGAVHHQGDIYDSTVACLPFLFELVGNRAVLGRGPVAELFSSLGESLAGAGQVHGDEDADWLDPYQQADALIRSRADEFVAWLSDADAEVRAAAAAALAYFAPVAREAVLLFERRLVEEPEVECRLALIEAAVDIAVREPDTAERVADWLPRIAADADTDPGTRLAALAHLARLAPGRAVDDLTGRAIELLREISTYPSYTAAPVDDRPATPTLTGEVRVLFAPEREGRADAWTADLVRVLHDALAEAVADRIVLIADQLDHPDPGRRGDALRMGSQLIGRWRGPFEQLVALIGGQLDAPEYPVRYMAALALQDTYDLASPAADALAAQVVAMGPDAWSAADREVQDPYRMMLLALARMGDPRAVPGIAAALAGDDETSMLVQTLGKFGNYRHEFEPDLLERLAAVPTVIDREMQPKVSNLLSAARYLGTAEAVPMAIRILNDAVVDENQRVAQSALHTLKAAGPASQSAMPCIRRLTQHSNTHLALLAIESSWAVTQDIDEFLSALRPRLDASDPTNNPALAAVTAAIVGAAAASLADRIQPLIHADDLWTRVRAATALIKITGTAGATLPVLADAWHENLHTRLDTAGCISIVGADAAEFLPLLRAELAEPRRYTFRQRLWSSSNIPNDENLLKMCAEAVERIAT
ncbi:MAG: PBS lyase [Catenulispora sp.]|nr:PBS lyase [Catenulispora sp.]